MQIIEKIKTTMSRYGIAIVLVFLIIGFSFASPSFLTFSNLLNVLRQISPIGIAAVGMTMVIITGGIDLSVGSVVAVVGVICSLLMTKLNLPVFLVIFIGLFIGLLVGILNAFFITKVNIPPFIFTLGLMTGLRGVGYILTRGMPVFGFTKEFDFLGKGYLFGIPVPVVILFVVFGIGWVIVNETRLGRYMYAIGGNPEATRLSGVSVHKSLFLIYIISGILSSLAGLIILSRLSSGQPSAGQDIAFDVITAVVLGGISITGGGGRFSGIIFGVIILGILSNGMTLLNVYDYYQMVIKFFVLVTAMAFDQYTKRDKKIKVKKINIQV